MISLLRGKKVAFSDIENRSNGGNPMKMAKLVALVLISCAASLPAFGMTYKNAYPNSCNELWGAVKDTLSNQDNYDVHQTDDAKMHAEYKVKHEVHVNISGAILQRTNKVTLVPKGAGCEMQVVSNYSGWEHNDQDDFKTRVEKSLEKLKAAKPPEPAEPVAQER